MTWTRHIPLSTAAKGLGYVVLAVTLVVAGRWTAGAGADDASQMQVRMVQDVMAKADLEASGPVQVKVYEAPDSTDTRTDCVEVPTWLRQLHTAERNGQNESVTPSAPPETGVSDTAKTMAKSRTKRSLRGLAGLPYIITPVTGRRPTLSVTTQTVTLSAIDPRDGSGLEYSYDVPSPTWSLDAEAGLSATVAPLTGRLRGAAATSTLGLNRHWDDVSARLGVGPTATTDRLGATVSLTLTRTLISR
jgi:hypothetical protein